MKLRDVFLREATYRVRSTRGICWKGERGRIRKKREKKKKKRRRRKGRLPRPYNDRGRSEEKRGRRKSRYLKLHGSFYYLSSAISASTRSRIFWPGDRSMICAAASRIRRRSIGRHRSPARLSSQFPLFSPREQKKWRKFLRVRLCIPLFFPRRKKGDYTPYPRLIFSHRINRYLPVKPRLPRHRLLRREVFQRSSLFRERGCC